MAARRHWGRRVAWLFVLWLAGVAAMATLAALLRGLMRWAGLG